MDYILFTIYLVFFSWLITRTRFFTNSGLSNQWLITLFIIKIIAGITYGFFCTTLPNWQKTADTWKFFFEGRQEAELLFSNPSEYFTNFIANSNDNGYRRLFTTNNSYWNDLKHIYMVKIVSIFNVFSGSRYNINVIFYSYITFFGPVAFMKIMNDVFPGKKLIITAGSFLIPSFLFWSSGIHKDGLVFMFLVLAAYYFYFALKEKKIKWKAYLVVFLFMLTIFPVRNHIVLAALPAFAAWWLSEKFFARKWISFALITVIGTTVFFTTKYIHPKIDLPISIVMRQIEFKKLGGNSMLPLRALKSTFPSFVKNAPQALNHTMARPYITEIESSLYLLSAVELVILWLIVSIWFFRFTSNPYQHSVVLFFLMVSMALLLLTGYIVPQLGAIVRYRSIFLPLLMVPILATSKWPGNILK